MNLTIFAATGGIGSHVVDQALDRGHQVLAAVRSPDKLQSDIASVEVDLSDPDPSSLEKALDGSDAVLSALGPRGKHEYGIVTEGTQVIVDAMEQSGPSRLVVVSGAGVSTVPTPTRPNPPIREAGAGLINQYFNTPLARLVLGEHIVDVATMEDVLRASTLDWTAVRAPLLTNGPLTGRYRTARGHNVPRGFRLSRADTAHFMLEVLEDPDASRTALAAAY